MLLPTKHRVDRRTQRNRRARALRPRRLAVEPLEPRRLLAADGVITGMKWLDADGDGQRGDNEPGLASVAIFLDANEDGHFDRETEQATLTGEGGRYAFRHLPEDVYTVVEVVQPGWEQTFPAEGVHQIELGDGQVVDGVNFGNRRTAAEPGSIHGHKWNDLDGNGRRDSDEPGLPGVTVYSDLNLNGRFDDGEPHAVTMDDDPDTNVDESGAYWLENLRPGRHVVREVVPDGFEQTFPVSIVRPANNVDGALDRDFATVHPEQIVVDLEAGEQFRTEVSLTIHPECIRAFHVDVVATDPDVNFENHTGVLENGCGGATSSFAVSMVGDGQPRMFDLLFVDDQFGGVLGRIPVQIGAELPGGAHLVRLEAGDAVDGINFGNRPIEDRPSSIHGRKWNDLNGNAQHDANEPGLPGVTIYSDLNFNGQFDDGEPVTISMEDDLSTAVNESGMYWLEPLEPGRHVIREVLAEGFVQTFPREGAGHEVSLDPHETVERINFGNRTLRDEPGSIHGFKFLDRNGDGERQNDEPGLAGVTIYIDQNDNGTQDDREPRTVTTGGPVPGGPNFEPGHYWFVGLEPGDYVIREVVPDGFEQTSPTTDDGAHRVALESGDEVHGVDFGNRPIEVEPGSIHGLKWNDADGDGQQGPNELGLGGVTIYLDLNRNGRLDDVEPRTITLDEIPETDFDEGGLYWFEGIRPGKYLVREVLQDQWVQTFPHDGRPHVVEVRPGSNTEGVNFGNRPIRDDLGSIHGFKFLDRNGDGERQNDEPGLRGVTIYIDLNNNGELNEGEPHMATTGDDPLPGGPNTAPGHYWFVGLEPSTYVIREVVPDGFEQTSPTTGEGAHRVALESGDEIRGIDFGNRPIEITPGSIHGLKWHDADGDGQQGPNELGLGGVTIYLDLNRNARLDDIEPRTITLDEIPETDFDEGGLYWFEGIRPGEYLVREVLQDQWEQTFPHDGRPHVVEVRSGSSSEGVNFGNRRSEGTIHSAIIGTKWWDRNGNAQRDPQDIGLAGFTIYLDSNGNGELDVDELRTETARDNPNTRFDESGRYAFEDLAPGVYLVREVQRRDWQQTFPREDAGHEVHLDAGQVADHVDFGNRRMGGPPADLTGDGWVDFQDLTILLAHWNQTVSAGSGNLVDPANTPINFQDLTFLLAAWTGPGPVGAPQGAAIGSDPLSSVEQDRINPVTTSTSEPASDIFFNRLGRREARRHRLRSPIRRLQSTAVDRAIETNDEAAGLRIRAFRRK